MQKASALLFTYKKICVIITIYVVMWDSVDMRKIKDKTKGLNILITVLMVFLGCYRCFVYPMEMLLSGKCYLENIPKCFADGILTNIFNFNFPVCLIIIFALYSKSAKGLLLTATCLLWIKSGVFLFLEQIDVGFRGGTTDFSDFLYIRLNGYFYLSLFIIILSVYILEKRKKNVPYQLRFSLLIPFALLVAVFVLRMLNYEEPSTYRIDDRVVLYFSDSEAKVQQALILFTNTVNKTVEVIRCISFTLLFIKILNFFPKKREEQ